MNLIKLKPRLNKANNQINFQLKRKLLPKEIKSKLPKLKEIKLNIKDFEWYD